MIELPAFARQRFLAAGWHPGRRVLVSAAFPPTHPPAAIPAAFGGPTITPDRSADEECAPDDLAFHELWPDDSITSVWGGMLCTELIGVADMHRGHGEMYVAADGRCFGRRKDPNEH
jgi:hypothetical protein